MYLRAITILTVTLTAITIISGSPLLNKRILGGIPVQEGELPFFAQMAEAAVPYRTTDCGGVLIGPQTVLTAGHCLDAARSVYLGSVKKKRGRHLRIVKAVRAGSDNDIGANDIAVVFLSEKVDGPYALIEDTSYPEEGSNLTVAGFGLTRAGDLNGVSGSRVLLKVQVNIGSKSACAAHKKDRRTFDPDTQVCATDKPLGHSACSGDSGGPLYTGSGKDLRVVGLVSGPGDKTECGEQDTYQYYTFIKPYISWIKSETKKFEKNGTNSSTDTDTNM